MHHLKAGVPTPEDNDADRLAELDAEPSRRKLFGLVGGVLAVGGLGLLGLSSTASAQSRPGRPPALTGFCAVNPSHPRCRPPRPRGWKK